MAQRNFFNSRYFLSGVSAGKKASMKNAENSQNFNFEAVMTFCENLQKHFGII